MSFDRLLRAKEELEKNGPVDRPLPEQKQVQTRKARVISGHLDKQSFCHCNYDQACTTMVCARCDRKVPHNQISVIERDENGMMTTFYYRPCMCGAKKWLYGCEALSVRKTA